MEKQLSAIGYWLGLICFAFALIFRLVVVFHTLPPFVGTSGGAKHLPIRRSFTVLRYFS